MLCCSEAGEEVFRTMNKYKFIDLFAGCGGMTDGFMKSGYYEDIASVEWLKPQVETMRNRLAMKWGKRNAVESVMHFDIQREEEFFKGWHFDKDYGSGKGMDYYVENSGGIDLIIGGPPCQAYSVAGRVRDENGMQNDYRNYLFEHYLAVVRRYTPKLFVFENVPGLLSATPKGKSIVSEIRNSFAEVGYLILPDLNGSKVEASDYGVPQNRTRLIIVGINKRYKNANMLLNNFYCQLLPSFRFKKKYTVYNAIGDLPSCVPFFDNDHHARKISHDTPECAVTWHIPRYHSVRDMETFKILAEDVESGRREYNSHRISELYAEKVGALSQIHRYHVLEPNKPSTTIIAHLYKDGNRFIHYDSKQCRSITVREAARLQSFDDSFDFIGSRGNAYQMIGNAVPPKLALAIAKAIKLVLDDLEVASDVSLYFY